MHSKTPFSYCIDSFLNKDVAQKVERSFRMREERGWMPRISNFSEKTGSQKTNYGKLFR